MKKIIITLILSLSFLSTYADMIAGPFEKSPCYNDKCIDLCKKETGNSSSLCKYDCVCGYEKFNSKNIESSIFLKDNIFFKLVLLVIIFPTLVLLYSLRKKNKDNIKE